MAPSLVEYNWMFPWDHPLNSRKNLFCLPEVAAEATPGINLRQRATLARSAHRDVTRTAGFHLMALTLEFLSHDSGDML